MGNHRPNDRPHKLGVITHGSLSRGVEMKLGTSESVEDVKAGTFAVIQGQKLDFFSLITDVTIAATREEALLFPPGDDDHYLRQVMAGTVAYTKVQLHPMLMMENVHHSEFSDSEPRAVKTVPEHFSQVAHATEDDIQRIFGSEDWVDEAGNKTHFWVGSPIGMDDNRLCINLRRFVERSNAVFGKTGTGKTFLTRLLLCGLIKTGVAANLVFDMHSEYGDKVAQEAASGGRTFLKGMKDLFPSRVAIFSLDPEGARQRGSSVDVQVFLYADQIEPSDILPLKDTLNLTDTAEEVCGSLRKEYGRRWLIELLSAETKDEQDELAQCIGAHEGALGALRRRMRRLARFGFFSRETSKGKEDVLDRLMGMIDEGKSVIFEFGKYNSLLAYLLVANVVTRRLRRRYISKVDEYRRTQQKRPRPLMITIEEAHKFLAKSIAHETPFGQIAREMRKYFVSLLIVDQRPGAIDDEVLSQIGTKLVAQLNDDKDIAAVLVGERNSGSLRNVLATIDGKQQALLMGHALPMPILIKSRTYDAEFFEAVRERSLISDDAAAGIW